MTSAVYTLHLSHRFCPGTSPCQGLSARSSGGAAVRAEQKRGDKRSSELKSDSDDTWSRASLSELEKELGIKPRLQNKSQVPLEGSSRPPRNLSREEWKEINEKWEDLEREALGMDPAKVNKLVLTLQEWGQWLLDRTKDSDDADPRTVAAGLLLVFCVWFALLLAYAGVIEVPFHLPFLD